jgi:UrcA family protein
MTMKTLATLAATMTLALPVSALASSTLVVDARAGTETRSIMVSVADLNLANAHGARLANSRIDRAAKQACGWLSGSIQQPTREFRDCYSSALESARGSLDGLAQGQHQG